MTGLERFFEDCGEVIEVRITRLSGSGPREEGAVMYVAARADWGTIGGGQLEYMALDEARKLLSSGNNHTQMYVTLGPDSGQCCGGQVDLVLTRLGDAEKTDALAARERQLATQPEVLIFGAGHVGRALARALMPLPLRPVLIDSRAEELAKAASDIPKTLIALPESQIHTSKYAVAAVILTHDHALDFLLAAEAMRRGTFRYVGMIGSKTKRAAFAGWMRRNEPDLDVETLICPMAAAHKGDKRPEVIAAFVAAEILQAVLSTKNILKSMEASR
ncbi:xanthine dehydrogenase accessory protein XdhC [Marimonas lutisalis]|uniref:xanthine dehydrogenase accessory protein XdhC n=1 Tax=Marimonas lutisalis TaxID=2545756 RepID=UPI0010F5BB95|nr:xanthine dehydrogenase accessory protein XdhC [Marimonas lutisalis]